MEHYGALHSRDLEAGLECEQVAQTKTETDYCSALSGRNQERRQRAKAHESDPAR
jgi:hypothetical protein